MATRARIIIEAYEGSPTWRSIERSAFTVEVDDDEMVHALMDELAALLEPYVVQTPIATSTTDSEETK
jgi:hypothetical protein